MVQQAKDEDAPIVLSSAARSAAAKRANAQYQKNRIARGGAKETGSVISVEKIYSAEEMLFMQAVEAHKARTGRKFPALSELLGVLKSLGYERIDTSGSKSASSSS